MKIIKFLGLCSIFGIIQITYAFSSKVTTESGVAGRFGDQLLLYCKGKFQSKRLGLPFLFKPFSNSDLLVLNEKEQHYSLAIERQFRQKKKINYERGMQTPVENFILYEAQFFGHATFLEDVTSDKELVKHLREMIKPKNYTPFKMPQGIVTVAVHVRKGGGFDKPLLSRQYYTKEELSSAKKRGAINSQNRNYQDVLNPTKFPPNQFYVDQIIRISETLNDEPLYVYIFTDDQEPLKIAQQFEWVIQKTNIVFDCRKQENHYSKNIAEDMIAMSQFDYLIRPESAYSIISQILGHHRMVIYPEAFVWYDDILSMERIKTVVGSNK